MLASQIRIITLAGLFLSVVSHLAMASPERFRVVIDPGHGGSDFGTVFRYGTSGKLTEKSVTLNLSKDVSRELRKRGYSVILTRERDQEVPLAFRTQLANKLGADIFLSIHMNSASDAPDHHEPRAAEGIETYILNNTSDATSRRLAQLENSVLTPGIDRDSQQTDVALILKDLRLDANLAESKRLACAIQGSLIDATRATRAPAIIPAQFRSRFKSSHDGRRDRGVKQAMFHVLLGADMPSVLVEAGFLSNPRDRAWVATQAGRQSLARAIAGAIDQYKDLKNSPRAWISVDRCKVN